MNIPNRVEFLKGYKEFERHEKRDAMYKVANFLVSHFWVNLQILQMDCRWVGCIAINMESGIFRNRDISNLNS